MEPMNRRDFLRTSALWASSEALAGDISENPSIAVIPDWQYVADQPANPAAWLNGVVDWIIRNRSACNIIAVVHEGDMVNNTIPGLGGIFQSRTDYAPVAAALSRLDAAGIPWLPCAGNHDMSAARTNLTDPWYPDLGFIEFPTDFNTGRIGGDPLPEMGGWSRAAMLAKRQPWWNSASQW